MLSKKRSTIQGREEKRPPRTLTPHTCEAVCHWLGNRKRPRSVQRPLRCFLRTAACLLGAAITAASLVPPSVRPVTSASHSVEHLATFVITGLAFGLAYQFRHAHQAIYLVAFAGAVEAAQLWVPGRHARIVDFIVDAISACTGVVIAWIIVKSLRHYRIASRNDAMARRPRLSEQFSASISGGSALITMPCGFRRPL